MFRENKNLKDSNLPLPLLPLNKGEEQGGGLSYTKTNKLITALYMVTDIIDKDEPLRNKLRTLGAEIISDTSSMSKPAFGILKINQILSFLDIASAMNIISEMNCSILKKEFLELNQSMEESSNKVKTTNGELNLSEFFKEEFPPLLYKEGAGGGNSNSSHHNPARKLVGKPLLINERGILNSKGHYSIGHRMPTRLGVQKGSTLMKALSDKIGGEIMSHSPQHSSYVQNFNILKKQRRNVASARTTAISSRA